jgi:hypothetical protein
MSHPPILAVAIAGALALATAAETYHAAYQLRPGLAVNATTTVTPAQKLNRALEALRIAARRDGASAM